MTKIESYFLDREEPEQVVYEKLLTDLKNKVPEDLLKYLPYVSFIMLKPDAYLRGLAPGILEFLQQNEVSPVKHVVKQLRAADIDRLYMFVKPKYQESWWIMEKIYKLAPTCPTIVVGKKNGHEHLSARVREIVGPTTPLLGNESSIRYRFRGAHRIFNLIHGTDDPASAVREALVFFDYGDIKTALEEARRLQENAISSESLQPPSSEGLVPAERMELNLAKARYKLKKALHERCESELTGVRDRLIRNTSKTSSIDRLSMLMSRLGNLLHDENGLISEELPPKEEVRRLRNLHHLELRTCSLAQDTLREAISDFSRDSSLEPDVRRSVLSNLIPIKKCVEIARAMTTDVEFKESQFDFHLACLNFLNIPLSGFDEANLHAAWSVLSTEFTDFELKYPEKP
jgi:nucleoside diphosphate kinase